MEAIEKTGKIDWNERNIIGNTPVMTAIRNNKTEAVKFLLSHPKVDKSLRDSQGQTLFSMAKHKNDEELMKIFFENDECQAARARNLFDSNTVMYMDNFLEPESLEDHGLSFSDALHIIAAVFPAQPLTLEHLAMKKTLETRVPLNDIPRELIEKADKEI